MINDEWERQHEQNQSIESFQSWARRQQDELRPHHPPFLAPVLRLIGKELITLGSGLSKRFGETENTSPQKHSLN